MIPTDLRVSVVIPAYNAAHFLAEAIGSIRAQERGPAEIIVVDDGSTDQTAEVAASLGPDIRVLRQGENLGPAVTRNRGIEASTGTVIASLDADDLWPPDAMTLLMSRLEQPPYPAIAAGRIQVVGPHLPSRPIAEAADSLNGFALSFGCALIRRQIFHQIGLLDPTLRFGEDTDWFMRAREFGVSIAVVDATTLIYRRHGANATCDAAHTMRHGLEMLKRSLDRRRTGGKNAVSLPRWPVPPTARSSKP
jgi:glycosyltransferase involved in cell wall biosynthesis